MKFAVVVLGAGLMVCPCMAAPVLPDPGNMSAYSAMKGQIFHFEVTGAVAGGVWGTDLYTLDSSLAAAAVHAGILKAGERGVVQVTILAGQAAFTGSARNGVTSANWGPYDGAYRVEKSAEKAGAGAALMQDPGSMTSYAQALGQEFQFEVTGAAIGALWGTDLYTLDSTLAAAAVHAGVLQPGERGVVKVTILAGQPAYTGSVRNGVTSQNWGNYGGSYRVEKGSLPLPPVDLTAPANLSAYGDRIGHEFKFEVTGSNAGSVWGTDLYTLDSSLAAAAVHAGVVKAGEKAMIRVTILAGQQSYAGSARNGVTSGDWGSYGASYRVGKDK